MEFDINRVYTAINADDLRSKIGAKIIIADSMYYLKEKVKEQTCIVTLSEINSESEILRFVGRTYDNVYYSSILCYLLPEPEPEPEPEPLWKQFKPGDYVQFDNKICMVTAVDIKPNIYYRTKVSELGWLDSDKLKQVKKLTDTDIEELYAKSK